MGCNFLFLSEKFPGLEKLGSLAENYLYSDSNSCLIKLGVLAETIVKYMFELDGIAIPETENTPARRIEILKSEGMLPREVGDMLNALRKNRNEAVHEGYDSFEACKANLYNAHSLAGWFMQTYGDYTYEPVDFILPEDTSNQTDYQQLVDENERLSNELEKAKAESLSNSIDTTVTMSERKKRAGEAVHNLRRLEKEFLYSIDGQPRNVGQHVACEKMQCFKGIALSPVPNLTDSISGLFAQIVEGVSADKLKSIICIEIPNALRMSGVVPSTFIIATPSKFGEWNPWVCIRNEQISDSITRGFLIDYLFAPKDNAVELVLLQGKKHSPVNVKDMARLIQEKVPCPADFSTDNNISNTSYKDCISFHKRYFLDKLPTDEQILGDLGALLGTYSNEFFLAVYQKYYSK